MGRKFPSDMAERRRVKRAGRQDWHAELDEAVGPLVPLEDIVAELGFTQAEIDAADDE